MDYASLIKKWSKVSHFSEPVLNDLMYYAAERNKLDQRFDLLVKEYKNVFGRLGKANQAMFKTQYIIHELFKNHGHDTELLPHEGLFSQVSPGQEDSPELDAINKFLAELIPAINSKTKFDLDELISRTGTDPDAAKEIYGDLMKKLNR